MKVLRLRTGCRLHFGLMELATQEPLRFAGLGLMLDQPGFELSFTGSDWATEGSPADLSSKAASITVDAAGAILRDEPSRNDWADLKVEYERRMAAVAQHHSVFVRPTTAAWRPPSACHIRLISALPMHSGLGAGTQLACAVATGLELFARATQSTSVVESSIVETSTTDDWCPVLSAEPDMSVGWLAQAAGRGLRSAIGLFGFLKGGLILDEGYAVMGDHEANGPAVPCPTVRPLAAQNVQLASAWRIVLIAPLHRQAVSGAMETEWIAELGSLPNRNRNLMLALAQRAFTQASHGGRFEVFTDCLDQYMELAGQLFSRYQGGLYGGADIAAAVECARRIGLRGVGQSSWGPTVFGFAENQAMAQHYTDQLSEMRPDWCVRIAKPATRGAEFFWQ